MRLHHRLLAAILSCVAAAVSAAAPAFATTRGTRHTPSHTVFRDRFQQLRIGPGQTWGWQTDAYDGCTGNPGDWKLDRLTTDALSTEQGHLTITATQQPDGRWNTGLLTTGDSCDSGGNGAEVRTGDFIVTHVRLPSADYGAWPGLWTWRDGKQEMDIFEWHSDKPNTLEFVNHVRSPNEGRYVTDSDLIGADRWLYIGARLDADNTTWYLGDSLDQLHEVATDGLGVGPDFAAYPVLNLSVTSGQYHDAPTSNKPLSMAVDLLAIERPADRIGVRR